MAQEKKVKDQTCSVENPCPVIRLLNKIIEGVRKWIRK